MLRITHGDSGYLFPCLPSTCLLLVYAVVCPIHLPSFPNLPPVSAVGDGAVVKMIFGGKIADSRSLKKIPTSDAALFDQCKKAGGFVPYYIRQMQHATAKKALSFGFLLRLCQGSDEVPVQLKQVHICPHVPGDWLCLVEVSIFVPPLMLVGVVRKRAVFFPRLFAAVPVGGGCYSESCFVAVFAFFLTDGLFDLP